MGDTGDAVTGLGHVLSWSPDDTGAGGMRGTFLLGLGDAGDALLRSPDDTGAGRTSSSSLGDTLVDAGDET